MNGAHKLALTTTIAAMATLTGCSAPGPIRPASPGELQASFPTLRASFLANFSKATAVANADLPLSAEVAVEASRIRQPLKLDFLRWCARSGGTPYTDVVLAKPPQEVAKSMTTGSTILKHAGRMLLHSADPAGCTTSAGTYVLAVGARGVGRDDAYEGNAVVAWLTPEEIAARGPAALQAEAQLQKAWREQEARNEAARRAAASKTNQEAMGRREQFLDRSAVGAQRSCTGFMQGGMNINQLSYDCGDSGYRVRFDEFSQHGWRITSQMVTPSADVIGQPGIRITLIVEKVR